MKRKMIVILGPTATGKTRLAAQLASSINGEIISADSRQIYRRMDIGTGKDLSDYYVDGKLIKSHLIDVAEAGERYSIFRYKEDFEKAYSEIISRGKFPIVCGGSGMYIEVALGLYNLKVVKENEVLRENLNAKSDEELVFMLTSLKTVHNTTDTSDRERLIRAIEIGINESAGSDGNNSYSNEPCTDMIYGVDLPRSIIRDRITDRLHLRLSEGMINEVESLIKSGVDYETLNYYGLEYRFISLYLKGVITYDEMVTKLNTAIHQFAKRQMTWFRRMEKRGIQIKWLSPEADSFIKKVISDLNRS